MKKTMEERLSQTTQEDLHTSRKGGEMTFTPMRLRKKK
jgi:hypothetical protein